MARTMLGLGVAATWTAAAVFGFAQLWKYEGAAGLAARAPAVWPAQTALTRDSRLPVLVLLMHPKCPCSRATVEELAKLMAHCQRRITATVLMVRPAGAPGGWEQTDLWRSASAIPGVIVMSDHDGTEASRFGAATSGQALLYSADGRLLFAGGITGSRGHSGDNEGRALVGALALGELDSTTASGTRTPVYGCPLFDRSGACDDGKVECH